MTASGSILAISQAAHASTGPVPRACGSTMKASRPRLGKTSRIGSVSRSDARIRIRSSGTRPRARFTVSTTSGASEARGSNCFGRPRVLAGQKRLPIPPARTVT